MAHYIKQGVTYIHELRVPGRSAGQKTSRFIWHWKVHCLIHNSPPPNRSHADPPEFTARISQTPILILYCHQRACFTCGFLTSEYCNKITRSLNFHMCYMPRPSPPPSSHLPNITYYMFLKLPHVLHASPISSAFVSST